MKEYMGEITQASNKEWLGKPFDVNYQEVTINPDIPERRYVIERAKVKKVKFMSSKTSSNKSTAGTIGGAVVGGLLTGGAGAIVGGMVTGNHKSFDVSIAFELEGGEWFVARWVSEKSKGELADKTLREIETIQKHYMGNPFEGEGQAELQQHIPQRTKTKKRPPSKKTSNAEAVFSIVMLILLLWLFNNVSFK